MDDELRDLDLNLYYVESLRSFCRKYGLTVNGRKEDKIAEVMGYVCAERARRSSLFSLYC